MIDITFLPKKKFEDSFVKVAGLIGGEDYINVAKTLLRHEHATDEEIAEFTDLKINIVRKTLYDLFGRSLITGIRVRDVKRGWFVYRWKAQRDQVEPFVENQKKKAVERLTQRFDFEDGNEFYHCGNPTCIKYPFTKAIEVSFLCQVCGQALRLLDNSKLMKALDWKIRQINSEEYDD